ncbi:MAG: hypothetical protein QOF57_1344 [Frankiaceae bacterium]|nr:hypothetical protein [Frankiaceae bacterium]
MRALSRGLSLLAATAALVAGTGLVAAPANAISYNPLTVTGVADGATYNSGSVPTAGCSYNGVPTNAPAVTVGASVGGSHTETATCSYVGFTWIQGLPIVIQTPGGPITIPGMPMMVFVPYSAVATYTVIEIAPPTISVPADMTITATSLKGAAVSFAATGYPSTTCSAASGDVFPIGTTTVRCTATNDAGLVVGEFDVKVVDPAAVTVTVPKKVSAVVKSAKSTVKVSFSASAKDSLDGALPVSCNHASGSSFHVGSTKVTCTATNSRGKTISASFPVVVTVRR